MKSPPIEEKTKPFRLVEYFTFSSLIAIFLGTLVLAALNTHWARANQRQKSEDYALALVENLNHQVFLQFVIPVALKYGKIQLRNPEQFDRMDKVVRSTFHSFKVESVNIFDKNNVVSYSYDRDLIGKQDLGGPEYRYALEGRPTSRLVQRGNFLEIFLGVPKESKIITFAALRAEKPLSRISGPVLGVVEIVQDLSDEYRTFFRFQLVVILSSTAVMGVLFLSLLFVVKRGEAIIESRSQERLRLKEELSRAEHLSSLGKLTAGISHEIRNPLGIIRSSAEHLQKKMAQLDPENRIPQIIVEEAGRLNDIITDFLNYARPKEPKRVACRVEDIIEKNLAFLEAQLKEKGCGVERHIDRRLPAILADADMLYQAFLNILINAMQAMPDGGRLKVIIEMGNRQALIHFDDNGTGIPEEIKENIWNPFFTTKEMGTGLGLGIVKNIVESHDGKVWIGNRPKGGTRVTVALPLLPE
jgi:signal transduction histidine kinase